MDTYEPTQEERKNGWTPETLRAYVENRDSAPAHEDTSILDPFSKNFRPIYQVRRHPFKRY